jgi:membrane protein implicated in regulation of membrane protease activity
VAWSFVLEALGLSGAYFVARKVWWSWLVLAANSVLWVIYGWTTSQWGFVLSSTAFFAIYLRNAHKWRMTESALPADSGDTPSATLVGAVGKLTSLEP